MSEGYGQKASESLRRTVESTINQIIMSADGFASELDHIRYIADHIDGGEPVDPRTSPSDKATSLIHQLEHISMRLDSMRHEMHRQLNRIDSALGLTNDNRIR